MSIVDGYLLIAWSCACALIFVALLRKSPLSYGDLSSMQQVLAAAPPVSVKGPRRPPGHRHLRGSDFRWAIAFILPYAAVFFVFVVYPFGYALWMAREPSLYADLIFDPLYPRAIVNTLLFVGVGVNVKTFLALLLSGFFLRPRWWIKALLAVFCVALGN